MKKLISIVIAVYNEETNIKNCLKTIQAQRYKPLEIIVIDDQSTDDTVKIIRNLKLEIRNLILLKQNHLGPGPARNFGASRSKGEILVFVDSDMIFGKNFIKDLTKPIIEGKTIGTFSKNEFVANKNNIWSICWNINRNVPSNRMLPINYPNKAPVFRAILKKEFDKVGGFDTSGEYTDDWSLSRKLKTKSSLAKGAKYYHSNPQTLSEIYTQARWIGKNEFITGNFIRKIRSLILYSLPVSLLLGIIKALLKLRPQFFVFKIIYDFGIWLSVVGSFTNEAKYK